MSPIAFDGVTPEFAGRTVLWRVDLSIQSGDFVGLSGPNGAGKTTSMRAMRVGRRIFVLSADVDAEAEAHRHDHREPMHVRL